MKELQLDNGDLSPRNYREYYRTCELLISHFGRGRLVTDLRTEDFEGLLGVISKGRGPVARGNVIRYVRIIFRYASEADMIESPVKFGPMFKAPTKPKLRAARQAAGKRMFESEELRRLIEAASVPVKAMILLGINCGFGNTDVSALPLSALDLTRGWHGFPRPKTAVERRAPLWPETVMALKAAIAERPNPLEETDAGLVFITQRGHRWVRTHGPKHTPIDAVAQEFGKVLRELGMKEPKANVYANRNFYAIRHTFETVAGDSKDQVAVDYITGHADEEMAGVYREAIFERRLHNVVDHVHRWLFPPKPKWKMTVRKRNVALP